MSGVADEDTMHEAAQRGDLEAVRRFIEVDGVDVDCRGPYGLSALHMAVFHPNRVLMQPMLRYLISKNANVDAKATCVMLASCIGQTEAVRILLEDCRDTLRELDFCNLLLQTNQGMNIPLHYTKSVEIAKLLIEQPRRQHNNQLLSVCQAQLVWKNSTGQTPRENIAMRQQDTSDAELLPYLERYETSALSISGDPSSATKRHNLNNMCVAVKLNPSLNDFQQSVAQEAFDLIIDTTDCMDETAHAVLGYLSLLDVMHRTDKSV